MPHPKAGAVEKPESIPNSDSFPYVLTTQVARLLRRLCSRRTYCIHCRCLAR